MRPRVQGMQNKAEPRILITRLSAIGDCIQSLPLATALRAHFPRAFIAWAVEKSAAPLIEACPAVDRVIVVPKRMLASLALVWNVRQSLLPLAFDISIDPQSLSKSSAIGWLSGAKRRIGFTSPCGREISPWLNTELVASRQVHMVDRYLELLRPLGIEQPTPNFEVQIPAAAQNSIGEYIETRQFTGGYAVINPGAGWDSKRWISERFARVARHLGREHGLPTIVVWAGEKEHAYARKIARSSGGQAIVAPATSLLELAELMARAKLAIAADTGPLHLAAAMGTRCVGLFGSTRGQQCGPYGVENIWLQAAVDASPLRKRPGASNWAMRQITARMVCEACDGVLSRSTSHVSAPRHVVCSL